MRQEVQSTVTCVYTSSLKIDDMELMTAISTRRSYRSYRKDKPVSREIIRDLIATARKAPSSCNLQLTQYIVIDDKVILDELADKVSYKFAYAPVCLVVAYDPRITIEHHSAVMTAGMEIENLILRATELGLGTCPLAGFTRDEFIKHRLGIPKHLDLLLLVSIGYPERAPSYPMPKLPLEKTLSFNEYGSLTSLNVSARLGDHTIPSVIDYRSRIAAVYLDRFRLRTYSDSYYRDALETFAKFNHLQKGVLDLMSYDGEFARLMRNRFPRTNLTVSDYLDHSLSFLSGALGCETVKISQENELLTTRSFGAITFVFQTSFTPHLERLVHDSVRLLEPGGVFFLSWVEEALPRRLVKKVRTWISRRNKISNVYEGNPFYRIGPYEERSLSEIDRCMQRAGYERMTEGVAGRYRTRGVTVRFATYTLP